MKMFNYTKFILENKKDHSYFLPSYEECRRIADEHDNFLFYEVMHEVDGYKVSVFNYRLANWTHFDNPVTSEPQFYYPYKNGQIFLCWCPSYRYFEFQ